MRNKKGFEFSFGWLFALIIGAAILFLAIYGVVRLISTERGVQSAEIAKQLGVILIPAETGFGEGKTIPSIEFATETRIYNNCSTKGSFGEQLISVATSSSIGKKWTNPGEMISYQNKYLFSKGIIEGEKINVFSKPFYYPYKVGELLFLWSEKEEFCLITPPSEIENEIKDLGLKNINSTQEITNCKEKSKKICFYSFIPQCDVFVNLNEMSIKWKNGKISFYEGSLIYGAIFSDYEIYECQVQRLMKRTSELAYVYLGKSNILASRAGGCSQGLQTYLSEYAKNCVNVTNSHALRQNKFAKEDLEKMNNELEVCKLW
ncbi:MAG: hypothetical protein N3D20_01850 [Candidatus Pacearchaeota archaeon]|nr:hypothetical protein [Candidatus Pacearchaeota archaeon]